MVPFKATAPHIYILIRLHIPWFKEAEMISGKMKGRYRWKGCQNIWLLSHDYFPCGDRNKNSHNVVHACPKRQLKWIPTVRGTAGPPCLRGTYIRRHDLPHCGWAWGLLPHPVKQLLSRNPKRCKPDGMRMVETRQPTEWTVEESLVGQGWNHAVEPVRWGW
jgi:hypothetical protein